MAREKRWEQYGPIALTADGTSDGKITVSSTVGLHTKQSIILISDSTQSVNLLEVKKVLSETEFYVGKKSADINKFEDVSTFTVADNSTISAYEQDRPNIPPHIFERAEFEEEPVVARRVYQVDHLGRDLGSRYQIPLNVSTNYEKILRTIDKSNWLDTANFEKVETTVSDDRSTVNIKYYEDTFLIGEANIVYTSDFDWGFELFRYFLNDDGTSLTEDDGSPFLLE